MPEAAVSAHIKQFAVEEGFDLAGIAGVGEHAESKRFQELDRQRPAWRNGRTSRPATTRAN